MIPFAGTDRYRIERRIGAGGTGVVYEALDLEREERVALKTLSLTDAGEVYRLKKEFRALTDVAHPNLISFYELVREGDVWFFTMELVEGTTFIEYVRPTDPQAGTDASSGEGSGASSDAASRPLDLSRLRHSLRQLAEGIHHLHEAGTAHCDLKPRNVLVTTDSRVVVLDLGISSQRGAQEHETMADAQMGTVAYMAPEQVDSEAGTLAGDWYAIGVMLYEALTGVLPFRGSSWQVLGAKLTRDPPPVLELAPDAPADLAALCQDLLARDPEQRPVGSEILQRLGGGTTEGAAAPGVRQRETGVVGREPHLAVLDEAFHRTLRGEAVAVHVHGASGIGKTTLVDYFKKRVAAEHDALVLSGRCYPRESMPYKAVDGVVDNLARHLKGLPENDVLEILPADILVLARVFPVLLRVEGVANFPRPVADIPDAHELRNRAFTALRELFTAVAARQPLVVYIDDLQWADADSFTLLEDLLRSSAAPPLLLVSCFRGEALEAHPSLKALLRSTRSARGYILPVEPLTDEEATDLAETLLGKAASHSLLRAIVEAAAGSPFVLDQLVHHVLENELTEMSRAPLAEMLDARIARLPEGARPLLETLAVAERPVDFQMAHRAADISGDARALVATLEVYHLVRSSAAADKIELYHDRLRETLAAGIDQDRARRLHMRLVEAINSRGVDDPESLYEHYLAAGQMAKAGEQAARAGHRALSALAFDRAAEFFRQAIELSEPEAARVHDLQESLAEALARAGRPAEAADAYLAARRGTDPATAMELQRLAAEQLLFGGHRDRGMQAIRDLLRTVRLNMPPNRPRAMMSLVLRRLWLRVRGLGYVETRAEEIPVADLLRIDVCGGVAIGLTLVDNIVAYDFAVRYLLMALKAGEPMRVARALSITVGFSATAGGPSEKYTERLVSEARTLADRIGTPREIGLAAVSAGSSAMLRGEYKRAAALLFDAELILRDQCTGVMWELTTCQTFLMSTLVYLGEMKEVVRRLPIMVSGALERGNVLEATEARTRGNVGWLAMDDPDLAQRELDIALRTWSQEGFHRQHYNALVAQANVHLYLGDPSAALQRVERDAKPLEKSFLLWIQLLRAEWSYLRARCSLAVAAQGGDREALIRVARRDAKRIEGEKMPWIDPFAPLIRGTAQWILGDAEGARACLAAAVEGFEGAHMSIYAAVGRRRLGEVMGGAEGGELVRQADEVMAGQGIVQPARFAGVLAPGFGE